MKFTITREKLHEGLQAVAASVPSKTTLPVLANILVEASKDGLKLSGTDLDISVSTTIPASVDQEGSTTLQMQLVEIGQAFGGRDHSTVIHSVDKVQRQLQRDRQFRERVESARQELYAP